MLIPVVSQAANCYVDTVLDRIAFKWAVTVAGSCANANGFAKIAVQLNVLDIQVCQLSVSECVC